MEQGEKGGAESREKDRSKDLHRTRILARSFGGLSKWICLLHRFHQFFVPMLFHACWGFQSKSLSIWFLQHERECRLINGRIVRFDLKSELHFLHIRNRRNLGIRHGCDFHTAFVHQHYLGQSGVCVKQAQELVRLLQGIVGGSVLWGTTSYFS